MANKPKEEVHKYDKIMRNNVTRLILKAAAEILGITITDLQIIESTLIGNIKREVDHLSLFTAPNGKKALLNIEFQSGDDPEMVERMQSYHALIMYQYKLPVYQYCIYLGQSPTKMGSNIQQVVPDALNPFSFTMIEVRNLPYEQLLNSQTPEAVVLSILANPMNQSAEAVLDLTLKRLQQCCTTKDELEKYAGQILKLSKLRNLQLVAKQKINAMPIHYDVSTDILFVEGKAEGIVQGKAEGKAEGIVQGKAEGIVAMLKSGKLTVAEIAQLMGLPMSEVEAIQAKQHLF